MSENKFELCDLLSGMNTIATVMLVGRTMDSEFYSNSKDSQELFAGLCEMTKSYVENLAIKGGELELKQWLERDSLIESIDAYKSILHLQKYCESGEIHPEPNTRNEVSNELPKIS